MKQSRATDSQVKEHIEKTLQNKTSRASTASVDRAAERAAANVESERQALNAKRIVESKMIASRIFSKKGGSR